MTCRQSSAYLAGVPLQDRPLPQKSPPGRQFTGKIRLVRRPPGQDGFLPVNCRPEGDFSEGGDPMLGKDFLWSRQYFNKGETYQFCDYLFPGGFFFGGRHFNATPAGSTVSSPLIHSVRATG